MEFKDDDEKVLKNIEKEIKGAIARILTKHGDAGAHWQVEALPEKMARASMYILRVTSDAVDDAKNSRL